jgi:hypothetical protein
VIANLLELINLHEVSPEEAEELVDRTVDECNERGIDDPPWWRLLGLSDWEATAYADGARPTEIARLRYDGWPTECGYCHRPLDYHEYGWRFFSQGGLGRGVLIHLDCVLDYAESEADDRG